MRQGAQEEQGLLYTLFRKGMDCEPDKRKSPVHACGKAVPGRTKNSGSNGRMAVQGDYEDGYGREHFEKGCTRYRAGRGSDGTGKQHMKKEKRKKRITGTERASAELE